MKTQSEFICALIADEEKDLENICPTGKITCEAKELKIATSDHSLNLFKKGLME